MNNVISNPVGIDKEIQSIQTDIYNNLIDSWIDNIDAYGRVYRNVHRTDEDPDKVVPEWYSDNNEYKDVFYNDEFACVFTFIDDEEHTTEDGLVFSSNVKCVFMVNLEQIYIDQSGRNDMKAQAKVVNILQDIAFERYSITGITKGIKNVFRGFNKDGIKFTDTHPYHCFSIDIDLTYYITENC